MIFNEVNLKVKKIKRLYSKTPTLSSLLYIIPATSLHIHRVESSAGQN